MATTELAGALAQDGRPGPARPILDIAGGLLSGSAPRFLLVGLVGLATDATAFAILARAGFGEPWARALSLALATVVTWRLNRRFTFRASGRPVAEEAARYVAVALAAQGFNWSLFLLLRTAVPQAPALAALVASAVCAAGFSFAGQRALTFSRRGSCPMPGRSPR